MKAPASEENTPLYEYTDMPCHMRDPFSVQELSQAELIDGFPHMNGAKVMKIPTRTYFSAYKYGTRLYDLQQDPQETHPIEDAAVVRRLEDAMVRMMKENEAPEEQYERIGLKTD